LFEWLDHFLALLAKSIIELKKELLSAHNAKGVTDQEKHGAREVEISNIKADIDRVRKLNIGISTQVWQTGLEERYNRLRQAVAVAGVWPGLEFGLSSMRVLNIHGCTLPFIGILLARPPAVTRQ